MTASLPRLPDEHPEALSDRAAAWKEEFQPHGQVQGYVVERIVVTAWQLDRCDRAIAAAAIDPCVVSLIHIEPIADRPPGGKTNPIPAVASARETNPIPAMDSADETNPISGQAVASADRTVPTPLAVTALEELLADLTRRAAALPAAGYPVPIPRSLRIRSGISRDSPPTTRHGARSASCACSPRIIGSSIAVQRSTALEFRRKPGQNFEIRGKSQVFTTPVPCILRPAALAAAGRQE
jgi:hypothetical protein